MRQLLILMAGFVLSGFTHAELNLEPLKGKVVYLDFWASWCGPCRSSFPWMNSMQKKYEKDGLVVVAVNLDQEPELAEEFIAEMGPEFRIEYDSEGELAGKFGVSAMPTSYLIGRDGEIRVRHLGFHDKKRAAFEQEIQTLLGEE